MSFEKGNDTDVTVLFKNIYYFRENGLEKGYIFIEKGRIKEVGKKPSYEHELSNLVYDFEYNAVAYHGFSYIFDPRNYPCRGFTDICRYIGGENELKNYIIASVNEMMQFGMTLPILHYSSSNDLQLIREIKNTLKIEIAVFNGDTIELLNANTLKQVILGKKDLCNEDVIDDKCTILYSKYTLAPHTILHRIMNKADLGRAYKLLTSGYRVLNISNGYIDTGVKADIIIYLLEDFKKPLYMKEPLSLITRGYRPDLVVVDGEILFEKGYNYLINERELLNKISSAI